MDSLQSGDVRSGLAGTITIRNVVSVASCSFFIDEVLLHNAESVVYQPVEHKS